MSYTNEKSVAVFGGIGLLDLVFVVFLALKLAKIIDWSWWWVTAPLWGQFALAIVASIIILIIVGIIKIYKYFRRKK